MKPREVLRGLLQDWQNLHAIQTQLAAEREREAARTFPVIETGMGELTDPRDIAHDGW